MRESLAAAETAGVTSESVAADLRASIVTATEEAAALRSQLAAAEAARQSATAALEAAEGQLGEATEALEGLTAELDEAELVAANNRRDALAWKASCEREREARMRGEDGGEGL